MAMLYIFYIIFCILSAKGDASLENAIIQSITYGNLRFG
jgi:hypothetical protein